MADIDNIANLDIHKILLSRSLTDDLKFLAFWGERAGYVTDKARVQRVVKVLREALEVTNAAP